MQHIFFLVRVKVTAWHNDHAYTQGGKQGDEPGVSASRTYAGGKSDVGGQRAGEQERGGTASCAANNDSVLLHRINKYKGVRHSGKPHNTEAKHSLNIATEHIMSSVNIVTVTSRRAFPRTIQ